MDIHEVALVACDISNDLHRREEAFLRWNKLLSGTIRHRALRKDPFMLNMPKSVWLGLCYNKNRFGELGAAADLVMLLHDSMPVPVVIELVSNDDLFPPKAYAELF